MSARRRLAPGPATRRRGWRVAAATLAAAGLVALLAACGAAAPDQDSTLRATYVDRDGNGTLERGPDEPLIDRTQLARASHPVRPLALMAQISDAHVVDPASPARVPFLDRFGPPLNSTYRPQEALTTQVLAASVRAVDHLGPQAVVATGDLVDNDQADELDAALTALRGGVVHPPGMTAGYQGVQSASDPDPLYYRPDVDFPRHRGLLAAAARPFRSPGLDAPWYPALGNHDVLVQGEIAPTARTQAVAVGDRRVTALDPSLRRAAGSERSLTAAVQRLLAGGLPGPTAPVHPDPRRRELPAAEVVARLRAASALGRAGGGAAADGRLDYAFDVGRSVRAIVLDTVHRDAGSGGTVDDAQVAWLRAQLAAAGRRWVLVFSHQPLTSYASGRRVLAALDRSPRVVAAVAGHTHHDRIVARPTRAGGYWLVTTASLIDHPQQARALRLVQTANGGVALETWMVDHDGGGLAEISRQLAYLDVQGGRVQRAGGRPVDRNARLYLLPVGARSAAPARRAR